MEVDPMPKTAPLDVALFTDAEHAVIARWLGRKVVEAHGRRAQLERSAGSALTIASEWHHMREQ
jgi:hypothetical protein